MGSLTGEVDSKMVTESYKGTLVPDGNRNDRANPKECLTARHTGRAETKVGVSDLAIAYW